MERLHVLVVLVGKFYVVVFALALVLAPFAFWARSISKITVAAIVPNGLHATTSNETHDVLGFVLQDKSRAFSLRPRKLHVQRGAAEWELSFFLPPDEEKFADRVRAVVCDLTAGEVSARFTVDADQIGCRSSTFRVDEAVNFYATQGAVSRPVTLPSAVWDADSIELEIAEIDHDGNREVLLKTKAEVWVEKVPFVYW